MSFDTVNKFESAIAKYFGAPYGIAVDCCTHGIELCLRYKNVSHMVSPYRTYVSIPLLSKKLNIELEWQDIEWEEYYYITPHIIDGAVLWKPDSYIPGTFINISFQFQKHLNLGRGGVILTDDKIAATTLKKMSYDGRLRDKPWRDQDIDVIGYHYYMTPETAQLGLEKLPEAINTEPKKMADRRVAGSY